jgi:hypothetical protein
VRVAEVQMVWNHLDRGTKEFFQSVQKIKQRCARSCRSTVIDQRAKRSAI